MQQEKKHLWWQTGIVYEIYVRSFQDSNGDGIGDISGILQRLDYLQWLGINALWLTPVFPSPMKDFGYDISDYTGIHSLFGTMDDFDELLREVHKRDMKLIVDLVPNHSSDQHPWFREAQSSRDHPKRDWYYWQDPLPDGSAPNNWISVLGGPAWEWHEGTGQYYYHAFLKEQPDLNLRNPAVQGALQDIIRFWLDKGVDGFRVDVMWHMAKDKKLRDNPVNTDYKPGMPESEQLLQVYSCDQPDVHDIVGGFREVMDTYDEKVMVGELYLPTDRIVPYYGVDNKGAHLPGNFVLLFLPWEAEKIAAAIDKYEASLPVGAWPNWVIGNHDRPRLIDRIGAAQSKVAATLLLTLRGTPILYYGDEIGMCNVPIPKDEWQDPQGLRMPETGESRDPERTPMQWSGEPNAGFTTGKPWLRISEAYRRNNVAVQQDDEASLLCFYKRLLALRAKEPSLHQGDYYPVITDGKTLAYIRRWDGSPSFLIVLNLTGTAQSFKPKRKGLKGGVILSTLGKRKDELFAENDSVEANEAVIVKVEADL